MIEKYLAVGNVIGATVEKSLDGGLLITYSTVDGKHFLKSFDNFRTITDRWVVPIDGLTANANLLRLNNGRLMTVVREISKKRKWRL